MRTPRLVLCFSVSFAFAFLTIPVNQPVGSGGGVGGAVDLYKPMYAHAEEWAVRDEEGWGEHPVRAPWAWIEGLN